MRPRAGSKAMTNSVEPVSGYDAPPHLTRARVVAILVTGVIAFATLMALGIWQVERLHWKQEMLASIDARINAAPRRIEDVLAASERGEDIDYAPVTLRGRFDHQGERFFLATRNGDAGWHVYTPLLLDGSDDWVFVNRGFVPYALKSPESRAEGNMTDLVEINGLAREAPTEKASAFLPDNDPAQNVFFWRNVADMAQGLDLPSERGAPFFVDAGPGAAPGGFPVGGVTVIEMPNNHLQYAITWFSLAAALFVMLGLFVRHLIGRRRGTSMG